MVRTRAAACQSIEDLRREAQRALPKMVFDYVDGAAQSESTARENLAAFERCRLIASAPANVQTRTSTTALLGSSIKFPLVVGPTGLADAFWPRGDLALARAAAKHGVPFVISNGANSTPEEIVKQGGRVWLQVYVARSREWTAGLLKTAQELGIEAIELTLDTAVPGRRVRDIRNGFGIPFVWTLGKLAEVSLHPGWMMRSLGRGTPSFGLMKASAGEKFATMSDFVRSQLNPAVTWEDLQWLRDSWKGKLLVKGLVDVEQMPRIIAAGFDGVVVSNHGGRQLDGGVATLDVLPDFVAAAPKGMPILVDGGVRSGTDILKALALGAAAVQIGRAALYGLSVAGEDGVSRALSILETEFDIGMALTGLTEPAGANRKIVRVYSPART